MAANDVAPAAVNPNTIIAPGYRERVIFVGTNGSGKTVLASAMLTDYPRAIILDVKGDFPVPWKDGEYQILTKPPWAGLLNGWRWRFGKKRIIYRPDIGYDSGKSISEFLDWIFRQARRGGGKKGWILYVDEGAWISYKGAWDSLARLLLSTRSLKYGIWVASQRPLGIPVESREAAWRWYIFFLPRKKDRQEIASYLPEEMNEAEFQATPGNYWFWEILRGEGGKMTKRLFPPVTQA